MSATYSKSIDNKIYTLKIINNNKIDNLFKRLSSKILKKEEIQDIFNKGVFKYN